MTSSERLTAIANGQKPDRLPFVSINQDADARIVSVVPVGESQDAFLALVQSPFGKALSQDENLLKRITENPTDGGARLAELEEQTRSEMQAALLSGATGIFYFLDGASPDHTTPMEYGGHFLEVDRRLMQEIANADFNILFINGTNGPYIDFVSDLPAQGFAWDKNSGTMPEEVRMMRKGALMGLDFELEVSATDLNRMLKGMVVC